MPPSATGRFVGACDHCRICDCIANEYSTPLEVVEELKPRTSVPFKSQELFDNIDDFENVSIEIFKYLHPVTLDERKLLLERFLVTHIQLVEYRNMSFLLDIIYDDDEFYDMYYLALREIGHTELYTECDFEQSMDLMEDYLLFQFVLCVINYVPAPRLVCVETNPGPLPRCLFQCQHQGNCVPMSIYLVNCDCFDPQCHLYGTILRRGVSAVGNEKEDTYSYIYWSNGVLSKTSEQVYFVREHHLCIMQFSLVSEFMVERLKQFIPDLDENFLRFRDPDTYVLHECDDDVPPPPLVGIETNPGPFDELQLISNVLEFVGVKPAIWISDSWGDFDAWEDDVKRVEEEKSVFVDLVEDFVMRALYVEGSVPFEFEYEPHMNNVFTRLMGAASDPVGVGSMGTNIKEASEKISGAVKEGVDKISDDGIKHVHILPEEFLELLRKLSSSFDSFALPDISVYLDKFCNLFPGFDTIKQIWDSSLDPKSKSILLHLLLASISCVAAKYELNWKTKLMVCAIQWGIVFKSGDENLKKNLILMHGLELGARAVLLIIPIIQSWILDPESDIEPHSNSIIDKVSFSMKHVIPIFAKAVISIITLGKCEMKVDSILAACKEYRQLINGYEFTVSSLVDLVRRLTELLASPFGFKLFKEAYNDYPEIYTIMDNFNVTLDILTQGKKLTYKDLQAFRVQASALACLEKKLSLKSGDAVYQSQVRVLRQTCDSLKKAFGCQGLRANNYRLRPFVVSLAGPSAIGKTPLMRLMMNCLAKFTRIGEENIEDFNEHPETYIHMWAECEFHDNMLPETVMLGYDDFAQTRKAATPETCPMRNLFGIVNNAPYPVNCSDNARKNTIFHEEEVVFLSFNRDRWNANNFHIYQMEAGLNRLGLTTQVCIKPEYILTEGPDIDKNWGYTLDKSKVLAGKLNLKVYTFKVYNVHDNSVIETFEDFPSYMRYVGRLFILHKQNEILRMNELSCSYGDMDLNPLLNLSAEDLLMSEALISCSNRDEEIELLIAAALRDYKAKERERDDVFDATSDEFKNVFHQPLSDPTNVFWYVSIVDGIWWQKIYSQDPGWANFVGDHLNEIFNWMDGTLESRLMKTLLWKTFSPTEIPTDLKVICSMFRLFYLRAKEASHLYSLAFSDIFNIMKKLPVKQGLNMSLMVIRDLAYMEVKSNLTLLGDTWHGLMTFCSFWTREMILLLPAIVSSAYVIDDLVARSGVRLKQVRMRPRKNPDLKKVEPVKNDPENQINAEYTPKSVDINRMAMQAASVIHKNNEYGVFVELDGKKQWIQSILFLGSRVALGNTHLAIMLDRVNGKNGDLVIYLMNYHSKNFIPVLYRYVKTVNSGMSDKTIFLFHTLSNVHTHKNIVKYVVDKDLIMKAGMNLLISITRCVPKGEEFEVERVLTTRPLRDVSQAAYPGLADDQYSYISYTIDYATKTGDCGGLVFISDTRYASSWYMVSMISAGATKGRWSTSTPLTKQWVHSILEHAEKLFGNWSGPLLDDPLHIPSDSFACSALPPKFIIESVESPCSQSDRTHYEKTKMFEAFGPATKYPAIQSDYAVGDKEYSPMYMARDKYCNSSGVYNPVLMSHAISMYLSTLLPVLFDQAHIAPSVFTPMEVTVGNGFVDATPRDTSEGFAYQLKKVNKKMLFGTGEVYDTDNVYCQELLANVNRDMRLQEQGVVIRRVAKDFGKDETLPIQKVLDGKLRLVSGSDVEDLTEDKCKLGYAVSMITANPIFSGTAVGMNPYSSDWDTMFHYFDGFDIIAGDFKNWDGVVFLNIAYMVLYTIFCAIYYNNTPRQNLGLYSLFVSASTSLHAACFAMFSVVYAWISGLASGRFFTLTGNSMYDCVILRYAILICYLKSRGISYLSYSESDVLDFNQLESDIRIVTLGDDHVIGIRKGIQWCTHQDMVWAFKELGIVYTDDTKSDEPVKPLRSMLEITFEQRSWRYCDELCRYVGPLNKNTLYNMLYWTTTNEANIAEVLQIVLDEFSLHGKEVFELETPPIIKKTTECYGIFPIRSTWLSCLYFITKNDESYH